MKLYQVAIAVDQLLNTILGGYADETLSARAFRTNHWLESWINGLFFWEEAHCFSSFLAEFERRQLPSYYRNTDEKLL